MPLYEFRCEGCGRSFELLLGFSQADEPQFCPSCGSQETHRKVSSFAVGGNSPVTQAAPSASSPFT